jgi:RNA 3'-terminal phosphate cyclase (ATP)
MLVIDGSFGEGGGQILRTSLGLSMVTGTPFRIENIRARRNKPGLLRQHLTSVNAAAAISRANVDGASLGSQQLTFVPGPLQCADFEFAIGSAGSTTLVLQTVLPALLRMGAACTVMVEGGTHNPSSPPFDFFARAFVPLLHRMGARMEVELHRHGFYPAGGGRVSLHVEGNTAFVPLDLETRGAIVAKRARALAANLPFSVAEREAAVVAERTGWPAEWIQAHTTRDSDGPGNVLTIDVESVHVTEVFTGFGEKGVRAEDVAATTVEELKEYLVSQGAVAGHLADQLLVPMAVGAGGSFTTGPLTPHARTNIDVIRKFLDVGIAVEEIARRLYRVQVATSLSAP